MSPICISVLGLYAPSNTERPSLDDLIQFVDFLNNVPRGTNWAALSIQYKQRSPLYRTVLEQFRHTAEQDPDTSRVIPNLMDQKDRVFHWSPLHCASATGNLTAMQTLVRNGADPFVQSNLAFTFIHAALESNALETLRYALQIARQQPERLNIDQANVWGETGLMMAAQGSRVACVEALLAAGADRNARQHEGQVALHYAGLSSRSQARRDTLELLCKPSPGDGAAVAIDAQDMDGTPPLFDFLDDLLCLQTLHHHGASLSLSDRMGNNVIHHACVRGESESLRGLLSMLAQDAALYDQKNLAGNTPLAEAMRRGNVECALALVETPNIDLGNTLDQDGWAAIHHAAKMGRPDLLRAVVRHSTFVRGINTADGKTARVVAMEAGTWIGDVKRVLKAYNTVV